MSSWSPGTTKTTSFPQESCKHLVLARIREQEAQPWKGGEILLLGLRDCPARDTGRSSSTSSHIEATACQPDRQGPHTLQPGLAWSPTPEPQHPVSVRRKRCPQLPGCSAVLQKAAMQGLAGLTRPMILCQRQAGLCSTSPSSDLARGSLILGMIQRGWGCQLIGAVTR